jgi:large subunit ribosomal protein L30
MATKKIQKMDYSQIKVTQIKSCIARKYDQEQTLIGLALNKMHKSAIHIDTPSIRGMIRKVKHLVRVEIVNLKA